MRRAKTVLQDLPAIPVVQERRETREPRAGTDLLEPRVSEARTVCKESEARLVPEGSEAEWEDLAVSVSPVLRETLVSLALLVPWVNKGFLDLRGLEDHQASPDCPEYPGKMDQQVRQESEVHRENMVLLDLRETQEWPVPQVMHISDSST